MKFVLVKDGADIVSKDAYSGDEEANAKLIDEKRLANPELTYEEVEEKVFLSGVMRPPQEVLDYDKLLTVEKKVDFIAKKLGLV